MRVFAETAEIKISTTDGGASVKSAELQKMPDGAFRLHIPAGDIPRNANTLEVRYQHARANRGDDGYWVAPDGVFGKFDTPDGVYVAKPVMPFFGMKTPAQNFAAIVKSLQYEFLPVASAKDGKFGIFPRFEIKKMYFAPYEDIIIDFYNLPKEATYADMAKIYRRWQLERGEVKPLKERIKTNKYLEYACKSVFVKISMSAKNNRKKIEHQNAENEPPLGVSCTFDESMQIMRSFKAAGMDNVQICYTGWITKGHDGRALQFFPVEEAVGGEAKMREAVALGKSLGYQMTCHAAYTGAFTISNRWDPEYIAKMPDGSLWKKSVWSGGRSYQPCMRRVLELFVEEDYKHIRDIGIEGLFHLDVNSAIRPPFCCDPKHPQTRKQGAEAMNAIQEMSHKYFGGQGSEAGFDHVARTLDFALYTSTFHTFPSKSPLVSGCVPLWQIVYHGIILSNPFHKTMYSIYAKDERDRIDGRLKTAEYGGRPVVYAGKKSLSNVAPLKKAYDEFSRAAYLQLEFIEDHREIAPDVFLTRYSNSDETITNYSNKPFEYKTTIIPAKDYKTIKNNAK